MGDVERVAAVLVLMQGCRWEHVSDNDRAVWCESAAAAMAETRRIDAEALREAIKNGDVWSNGWYAPEWLEQRANAPQQ